MLLHAEEFRRASIVLYGDERNPPAEYDAHVLIPRATLEAFACELYTKFLILIDRPNASIDTHNLQKLYYRLSDEMQSLVRHDWENPGPVKLKIRKSLDAATGKITTFDSCLADSAELFVRLRYKYENRSPRLGNIGAGDIMDSLRRVIFGRFPTEYADVRLPLPPNAISAGVDPGHSLIIVSPDRSSSEPFRVDSSSRSADRGE
jgi:hypothetical protein